MNNLIVLLIDGFSPRLLAPHGCTWIDTPTIDWLAGHSIVYQQAISESNDQELILAGLLGGIHPAIARSKESFGDPPSTSSLLASLKEKGFELAWYTDDPSLGEASLPGGLFNRAVCLNDGPFPETAAASIAETHLANSFAKLSTELPSLTSPFVAIVHLSSMSRCWDAPIEMREKFRDEEDPEASSVVVPEPKQGELDPDEILSLTHAYAAQNETLDTCLGFLTNELVEDGLFEESLFAIGGLRGFPLGHSRQFAHHENHVQADAIHVPLMVKPPAAVYKQLGHARVHRVMSTRQALSTLVDWAKQDQGCSIAGDVAEFVADRQAADPVLIAGNEKLAVWTPAWFATKTDQGVDLFVKPDDRWDVNPVQDRCRWIAAEFEDLLFDVAKQWKAGESVVLETLADELMQGLG